MSALADAADGSGAWVPGERAARAPLGHGALDGVRFAVKDLIDVAGTVTGAGNPDWAFTQAPAARDAGAVDALRRAGAAMAGKTVTDEFAFSLEGENAHHGTPCNPRAPERLPGGSSSGSAVAVAAGLVDVALGTDTGGSVRVPASFCGVFGFRPTHGRVGVRGVLPFAPSYDTVGWFARNGALLRAVGTVLLAPGEGAAAGPSSAAALRLVTAGDAFALADGDCRDRLLRLAAERGAREHHGVFAGGSADWLRAYAVLQGAEVRASHGAWIAAHRPRFGAAIAERFAGLAAIADDEVERWRRWRVDRAAELVAWLAGGRVLVLPTAPGPALLRTADAAERADFYARALALNAVAGHAGLPQLAWPAGSHDGTPGGAPLGLSLVGAPGTDEALLELASRW